MSRDPDRLAVIVAVLANLTVLAWIVAAVVIYKAF